MSTSSTDLFAVLRPWVVGAAVLSAAGCATQDQLRETEAQHGQASEALRAELRRTQDAVHALEVALAETRARSDSALATSREFLSSLVNVREEQRRQLDNSGVAFAELRRKALDLDLKLQAQQRAIEQSDGAFSDAVRRLVAVEAGLQDMGRRSGALEARAKAGQETDEATNRQLAGLRKQVEDTRSAMSSEGLLQLMRGLEDVRRSSASLRGSIDELQKAQTDAAAQSRNFYVDLDARIRLLKQTTLNVTAPITAGESALSPDAPAQDGDALSRAREEPVTR